MNKQKSQDIIKKKRKIIVLLMLFVILFMIAIGIGIGASLYNFIQKSDEQQNGNVNTLYIDEQISSKEDNEVLIVGIDDKNNTNENTEENNTTVNNVSKPQVVDSPYYIKVNNQANVVTVYKKDKKGKYTVPIKAMVCSIGIATPTSGTYEISDKYTWRLLEGNVYGQYACRITGSILFHSVPYVQKDKSTLEWWEYDKLGTSASLGCVRLTVEDAKWIYSNCVPGTKVEFYVSSTPGPLGKPTSRKISGDEEVRNWDPTDPDPNNPWKNYTKNQNKPTTTDKEEGNVSNNELQNNTQNITNASGNNSMNNNITAEGNNTIKKPNNENITDEEGKKETNMESSIIKNNITSI